MRDNKRTFIQYYFDQESRNKGEYAGAVLDMPKEIQTDVQAIAWANARMKQFPKLRVFNIERRTTQFIHVTEWEEK